MALTPVNKELIHSTLSQYLVRDLVQLCLSYFGLKLQVYKSLGQECDIKVPTDMILTRPTELCIVASEGRCFVMSIDKTLEGTVIKEWGSYGYGRGRFISPFGVSLLSDQEMVVLDRQANTMQVFSNDPKTQGKFLRRWYFMPVLGAMDKISATEVAIVDRTHLTTYIFDLKGRCLRKWVTAFPVDSITRLSSTRLALTSKSHRRVDITTHDGEHVATAQIADKSEESVFMPVRAFPTSDETFAVADAWCHQLKIFSVETGQEVGKWIIDSLNDGISVSIVKIVAVPERNQMAVLTGNGLVHLCHLVLD